MPIKYTAPLLTLAAIVLASLTAGCTYPDISRKHLFRPDETISPEITGPDLRDDAPLALDIHNERGSVWVEVDEKLDQPVVEGILSWGRGERPDGWQNGDNAAGITAARAADGPGDVLSIDASVGASAPRSAFLDLRVRTPRCDGINIVNNGGPIVMIGVGGAITAYNGADTGMGGRIELRTSKAITDPVALVTTRGRVSAVIGPGGRGTIDLESERGSAEFGTSYGTMSEVRPAMNRYHGIWNGGANPIIGKSADGQVRIVVKPNAEMYSIPDDWVALWQDR